MASLLTVRTAQPQNLYVGDKLVAPSANARTAPTLKMRKAQQDAQQQLANHPSFQDPLSKAGQFIAQQFVARPIAEIGASLANKTIKPTNPVTRAVLGNEPVKPVQETVRGTYRAVQSGHQNLPLVNLPIDPKLAGAYGVANAAMHVLNDAPVVGGVARGVTKVGAKVLPKAEQFVKAVNAVRTPLNEVGAVGKNVKATVAPVKQPVKPVQEVVAPPQENAPAMIPPDGTTTRTGGAMANGGDGSIVGAGNKGKATRFSSQTVPKNPNVSEATKQKLNSPEYTPNTEKQAVADAGTRYQQQGEDTFFMNAEQALNKPNGKISRQEAIDAQMAATLLDGKGDAVSAQRAADIYDKLSEHFTAAGQTVQAAAMMSKRSADSLMYHAQNTLRKAGIEMSPELRQSLLTDIEAIKQIKSKAQREYAVNQLLKKVDDNIPSDLADKITSTWKAGLLTGVKTQTGNFLSNGTFGFLHDVSNPVAVATDKALSLFTKQRTKTLTERGRFGGTVEGVKHGAKFMQTGVDERVAIVGKYEGGGVSFGTSKAGKALGTYVNGVFKLMGAADRPAYYSQLRNTLYDLGAAQAKNNKLTGSARKAFIKDFVENPPERFAQVAIDEANKAVLNFDTLGSKVFSGISRVINQIPAEGKIGKFAAKMAIGLNSPFVRVPSAFLSRTLDFTALGVPKEVLHQISQGRFDQRAFSTAVGEATTGTALLALGGALAQNRLLFGDYPSDPKEQQRWKAQGIQPNSVKVGGTYISLNYLGPVGIIFSAANRMNEARQTGSNLVGQAGQAVAGIPKSFMQQSFVQGLSNAANAINDPGRYASKYINGLASSVIPTISGDVATALDSAQREVNSAGQAIQAKIPKLRENLAKAQDVYGNDLQRKTNAISSLLNPFRPSDAVTNDVKSEVERLHNADPNNKDLQVTPVPIDKTLSVGGQKFTLTDTQVHDLQKEIGQQTQSAWDNIIKSTQYKALSDVDKANVLNRVRQDVTAVAQRSYQAQNNIGMYDPTFNGKVKSLTKQQTNIAQGNLDINAYLPKSETSTQTASNTTTKKVATKSTTTKKKSTGSRTSNKTQVAKLSSVIKAANKRKLVKSTAPPSLKTKNTLKKTPLKKYAVKPSGKLA